MSIIMAKKGVIFDEDVKQTLVNTKMQIRAICNPVRQQIIQMIYDAGKGGIIVSDIYAKLKLEQSITSMHLKTLRQAKMVEFIRKGKFIFYTVNVHRLGVTIKYADEISAGVTHIVSPKKKKK